MCNCIIAQSGGPTSVINASVAGLIKANLDLKFFSKVYAGINGIEGILQEKIIDVTNLTEEDINNFKLTPSSGLGSCRYKLKSFDSNPKEYEKIFEICTKYDISAFYYIGGNDSMDTIAKLSAYAREKDSSIKFIGIPKTIDNDLPLTDHTPGFGSAAKFIATVTLESYLDSSVYTNNGIFILETMGRDTGWLAASASVAKLNGHPVADLVYLPEMVFNPEAFLKDVRKIFEKQNQVYIVVSEGIKDKDGKFISELEIHQSHDSFGHSQLGGVASVLKSLIVESGITKRVKALELGVLQRCAMHCASSIDIEEAFTVGYDALKYYKEDANGFMVAIKRESNKPYSFSTFLVEANKVANHVKYVPDIWINEENNNLTALAAEYIAPLISEAPSLFCENNLPKFKVFNQ